MVSRSRRPAGQTGGVTTTATPSTKSLLTWTLYFLSAASGQAKLDHHVPALKIHRSATAEVAPPASSRADAGSSPAEIPLLNKDVPTAKFRSTDDEYTDLTRYQDAPAPERREVDSVRAPLAQSAESAGLTAISGARPLQDWEADDIILLSTIDGSLHARDRANGHHRWTLDMSDDPMIEATRHTQNTSQLDDIVPQDEYMFIVEPSKDGQLYAQFMDPAIGLVRLPATVKKMATEVPFTMHVNGQYLATSSEQSFKAYAIDAATGEVLSEFPKHRSSGRTDPQPRCRRRNELELEDPACRPGRILRLGRNQYTFTISDEQTDRDLCTIKFSEWVTNKGDRDLQQQHIKSLDGYDVQTYYSGKISGFDSSTDPVKSHRYTRFLDSPVAHVFDVIRSRDDHDSTDLVLLSRPTDLPFEQQKLQAWREEMRSSQRVVVNRTASGQWYALSERSYPGITSGAPFAKMRWTHGGNLLDLNGDLDEIVGAHILTSEQPATSMRLTISPPEIEHKNVVDTENQVVVQPPPQPPAVINSTPESSNWVSGFLCFILGGIIVLLLNNRFKTPKGVASRPFMDTPAAELKTTDASTPSIVVTEKPAETNQDLTKPIVEATETIIEGSVTSSDIGTPNHSRGQSAASVGSPKKKWVKIGDQEEGGSDLESDEDGTSEGNNDANVQEMAQETQPRRPKTKRGKRGGRKNNKKKKSMDPSAFDERPVISMEQHLDNGMVQIGRLKVDISEEKCLGRGSNGTAVYPGILDGREVAVKRLIKSANNLAEKEIKHLVSSDENPHVIRYFGKEESRDFFYIALDQFTTSLDQFIEHPEKYPSLVSDVNGFDIKDCLRQITDGVQHLHSLKLVHRDIKPQNVLVRAVKSNRPTIGVPKLQFVISDFGLCKPLEDGAMSTFAPTVNHTAAGTTGWRAPELLVNPRDAIAAPSANESFASSTSKTNSTTHSLEWTSVDLPTGRRATKAIDIFSLGCVFYYVMTRGSHPFDVGGSSLGRDLNIKENNFTTELMRFYKYEYDAEDLIMQMINHEPKNRPDTAGVLKHPYFWTSEQKLEFICLVSDCYEREKTSITDIHAKVPVVRTPMEEESLAELAALETLAADVIGLNPKKEVRDFLQALPRTFLNGMGKQRSYTGTRMIDLLRLIRNKKNHFRDLPEDVQALILARGNSIEEGYYAFWADRFPALLINCHANIVERGLIDRFRLERWYGSV